MNDKLIRGFIGGIIGGFTMFLLNYISWSLNLSTLRYLDFAGILIFGSKPMGSTAVIFAELTHLAFTGILGVFFVYLIPLFSSQHLLFRGWLYGVGTWFVTYVIPFLFQVEGLIIIPVKTVISNFMGASIFGIVLGLVVHWLDREKV